MQKASRYGSFVCLALFGALGATGHCWAGDSTAPLKAALVNSTQHALRWLDERDFKSLAQSTGGLLFLAEVLKAKGDDPHWQSSVGDVLNQAKELQAAARDEDQARCQAAIAAARRQIDALAKLEPAGKTLKPPQAALRPLMLTLDSLQADGKVALLRGHLAAAKNQAAVLAELTPLVSNSRTAAGWTDLAAAFHRACQAAADSNETDAKTVRQLYRGIAQSCEACHENSRQR